MPATSLLPRSHSFLNLDQYRDVAHKIQCTHYKPLHIVTMKKDEALPLIEVEELSWQKAARYMAQLSKGEKSQVSSMNKPKREIRTR